MLNLLAWIVIVFNEVWWKKRQTPFTKSSGSSFANVADGEYLKQAFIVKRNASPDPTDQTQQSMLFKPEFESVPCVGVPLALNRNCTLKINLKLKTPFCSKKEAAQLSSAVERASDLQRNDSWDSLNLQNQSCHEYEKKKDLESTNNPSPYHGISTGKFKSDEKHLSHFQYESPKSQYQEFHIIMKKRKLHTDTMQNVGETFGDFGHRDTKITGRSSKHTISERWRKVQIAVKSKRFVEMDK